MIRVKGTSTTEKEIAIFKKNQDGDVEFYGKNSYGKMSSLDFRQIKKYPLSSPCLMVLCEKKDKTIKKLSLRKQYKLFIKTADKLKILTDNKINCYKTGSLAKTALQLFHDLTKDAPIPDVIQYFESNILEKCKSGGIIYGKKYEGKAYKYDVVSQYPSIMRCDKTCYPYKEGKLSTLTKKEFDDMPYYSYGCYNVKIISSIDSRLFVESYENWYTHIDLNYAKQELNYTLEIVERENNFLDYKGCVINGAKIFRPFVDYLYDF